jgi:hypothetical protein
MQNIKIEAEHEGAAIRVDASTLVVSQEEPDSGNVRWIMVGLDAWPAFRDAIDAVVAMAGNLPDLAKPGVTKPKRGRKPRAATQSGTGATSTEAHMAQIASAVNSGDSRGVPS